MKIRSFVLISGLLLLLSGCASSVNQKASLLSFGTEGNYLPKYPVIMVPGLGFTGKFWSDSKVAKLLISEGWKYGGDIHLIRENSDIVIKPNTDLKPANFYTVTFSDNQAAIIEQGKELAKAIERVKELTQAQKVVLVGHSMGGLAAREYLQSSYNQKDVAGFISIGTPHLGSKFELKKPIFKLIPKFIQDRVWYVDMRGDAVRDLRPNSIYLNGGYEGDSDSYYRSKDINGNGTITDHIVGLNEMGKRPLPEDLFYVSVIGGGNALIATLKQSDDSDGIVPIDSQDLNEVPKVNVISFVIVTPSDHFGEANDTLMFMQVARLRQYQDRLMSRYQIDLAQPKSAYPIQAIDDSSLL